MQKKTANLLTDGFLKGFNNLDNSLFIFYNQIANGKNLVQKRQIWSCRGHTRSFRPQIWYLERHFWSFLRHF